MFSNLDNVSLLGLYFALNVPVNTVTMVNKRTVEDHDKLHLITTKNYSLWEAVEKECEARKIDIYTLQVHTDII